MEQVKPVERLVVATAHGMVVALLLCVPLSAQDQPAVTDPSDPMVTADSLLLDSESGPTRPRQLSNVPDDIGYQLLESEEPADAIFPFGPLTPLHDFWERANGHLKESSRLDVGLNYTAIYQRADTTVREMPAMVISTSSVVGI